MAANNDNRREGTHDHFFHYDDQNYQCNQPGCYVRHFRNPDGTLKLRNPHVADMPSDFLYHFTLGTAENDLVAMFSDVKFVCMGGTAERMEVLAHHIKNELGYEPTTGTELYNITAKSHRFAMFKVGPVLAVSHGMGVPSIGICLNEVIKLMYHAKAKDPIFFRLGTSGGIGLEPGTVVLSNKVFDEMGNEYYEQVACGQTIQRPTVVDQRLANELLALKQAEDNFDVVTGATMCANDFYEGQGRVDGAICEYTEQDKMNYLRTLQSKGVKNIEMEATAFAAMTHYCGIKSALVNVTLVDRLKGDQVTTPKEIMLRWQTYPQVLVGRYIRKKLNLEN